MNNCLRDTDFHFNDASFITIIGMNICKQLWKQTCEKKLFDTKTYPTIGKWQTAITELDEERCENNAVIDQCILAMQSRAANTQSNTQLILQKHHCPISHSLPYLLGQHCSSHNDHPVHASLWEPGPNCFTYQVQA